MGTEIELKLALAQAGVNRFRRHPLLKGIKAEKRCLLSIYFDTEDYSLSRRGIALRLRRIGYHWIQTLKAESANAGALTARPEWEVKVTGNQLDLAVLPDEARSLLGDLSADQLHPCFTTEFNRTTWLLSQGGNTLELALDQGEVKSGEVSATLSEVEFELKSGEPDFLYKTALGLAETLPLTLEPRSKAQRGYQLAGVVVAAPARAKKIKLRRGQPSGPAWRSMFESALCQIVANVPGVLNDPEPEYLHQMRIGVRRLKTILGLGHALGIESPQWTLDLSWLMGELSPARDWDVFATETLPAVHCRLVDADVLDALATAVAEQRQEAVLRARDALKSKRFVQMVLAAEQAVEVEIATKLDVETWARRVLAKRLNRLKRNGKGFRQLDAQGRHNVRIAAKRLRYSAEVFMSLHSKSARAYLGKLGKLQDALGVANDSVVAHSLLSRFANSSHAYASGLVEGVMTCEAEDRKLLLNRFYQQISQARPFWD